MANIEATGRQATTRLAGKGLPDTFRDGNGHTGSPKHGMETNGRGRFPEPCARNVLCLGCSSEAAPHRALRSPDCQFVRTDADVMLPLVNTGFLSSRVLAG